MQEQIATELLRAASLRVTRQRVAVLTTIHESPHAEVGTIADLVRNKIGAVSTQAVYGVLAAFDGAGMLRKIELAGSPARYEDRRGDNHHHLVCTSCQRIEDIDCAVGEAPCLTPSSTHGFRIDMAEVTFWGLCALCQDLTVSE